MAVNPAVNEGTTIRFYTSTPFTSISGTVVDPDVVTFQYVLPNTAPVTFTYTNGSGDPTNTIVRTATGTYHADIATTGKSGNGHGAGPESLEQAGWTRPTPQSQLRA